LGVCEAAAPDAFEVNDEGVLEVLVTADVPEDRLDDVWEAVRGCPMEALTLTDA
jgi:ferredoxin